jgi:superfamily I DNA and/or RNA helicase
MYSGQKRKIELACARHAWTPKFRRLLRVDTVDAYQGKENALVILSLVRSNTSFAPGHVRSDHRCNVAVSRARERLIIVGDCAMWNAVSEGSPMRRVLNYVRQHPEDGKVLSTGVLE